MTAVRRQLSLFLATTLLAGGIACGQSPEQSVFFAKEIWTGREVIRNAGMVVEAGRIQAIGPRESLRYGATATVHEWPNRILIPGLVAAQTNLAGSQNEDQTLSPEISVIDGFDFFEDRYDLLRSGVTAVQLSPGTARLMPGTGAMVRLAGALPDQILVAQDSVSVVLSNESRQPPRIYEPPVGPVAEDRPLEVTRPQVASLPASVAVLHQLLKRATDPNADVADDPLASTIADRLKAKLPLRVTANTPAEVNAALDLAKTFQIKVVLVDCKDLEPFATDFANWAPLVAGVVLTGDKPGQINNPSVDDLKKTKTPQQFASELVAAGIPVAVRTASDADLTETMYVAGSLIKNALSPEQVLETITSAPAVIAGVDNQIGVLAQNRHADFVVLSEPPFQLHCRVMATYVSGKPVFEVKADAETTVVTAGRVYLGDGHYSDAANIVVKGKTIRGIGASVSAPAEATLRDFGDAVIVPGFVDMGSGLGLGGPLTGNVALSTKLGQQLDADDPALEFARKNGITTVLLATNSSTATPVVAFKLNPDLTVLGDPVAIQFQFGDDTAQQLAENEKLLKAGKAYADSWTKYEADLAEYEKKKEAADKAAAEKPADKAAGEKADKPEEKPATDKPAAEKPADKEADKPEAKEKPAEKPAEKPKPKALPDPITGSWEGILDVERLPEQMRGVQFELELKGTAVTGNMTFFRRTVELNSGSYDPNSRTLTLSITQRDVELPVTGTLNAQGEFEGTMQVPRMGEVPLTAKRTVDKSKPVEKEVDKPAEGKDKPAEGKDKPEAAAEKTEPAAEPLKAPAKPNVSDALEPYRALFAGDIPAMVEVKSLYSIEAAAKLFTEEYKLRTILIGADDLARQPDLLHKYDVSIVSGPDFTATVDKRPPVNLPQVIANENLTFGFRSSGTTGSGQLPGVIQYAIRQGLSSGDALDALTQSPAKMLSKSMKLGRLASGNDADLVVLSGPPFEFSTEILAVMIDGVWVYEREESK